MPDGVEATTDAELASACMLLGIVAVIVTLFYFVSNPDADVRSYSWGMVGSTLVIFNAVLIFGAVRDAAQEVIKEHFHGGESEHGERVRLT